MPLTRRQREILDFISTHIESKGYAPSFEEIARQFGFQSLATVHEHLTNLERKGYIRRAHNGQTVIALVHGQNATVKKFYREPGGWIRLEPANPAMTPLRVNERDILVQGIVVGVIRKY